LSDVTLSRDNPFKATHLAWLSYTKINWRKQRFQKCMLELVLIFGTKWPFLGSWPMDYKGSVSRWHTTTDPTSHRIPRRPHARKTDTVYQTDSEVLLGFDISHDVTFVTSLAKNSNKTCSYLKLLPRTCLRSPKI